MSDFDKEAEREKLREKFEREEEKRRATEEMSELLLKGATMTNAHCSDCGDPIFRYDGQEFCPTCKRPVDRGDDGAEDEAGGAETGGDESSNDEAGGPADAAGGSADAAGGQAADGDANGERPEEGTDPRLDDANVVEVTDTSDRATVQFGSSDGDGAAADAPDATDANASGDGPDERGGGPESADPSGVSGVDEGSDEPTPAPSPADAPDVEAPTTGGTAGEHLAAAQVVLARTVERYARLAGQSDSPQAAREHLETARAAAEALSATKE